MLEQQVWYLALTCLHCQKHMIGLGPHKEQRVAKECNSIHPKLPLQTVSRRDPFFSYFYSKSGCLQEIPPLEVSVNLFLSGFPHKLFCIITSIRSCEQLTKNNRKSPSLSNIFFFKMAQNKWVAERFNNNKIQQLHQFPPSTLKLVPLKITSWAKKFKTS